MGLFALPSFHPHLFPAHRAPTEFPEPLRGLRRRNGETVFLFNYDEL
jgi:hypothetical protein